MNPMVTKNQKHMIDTQKLKNKEHKHTTKETKENYQATREETKKEEEEEMSRQLLNQRGNILQKNSN